MCNPSVLLLYCRDLAGERLNVCSGTTTCCTPAIESYLINTTHWQFHDRVLSTVRKFQLLFANVTSTFDGMLFTAFIGHK